MRQITGIVFIIALLLFAPASIGKATAKDCGCSGGLIFSEAPNLTWFGLYSMLPAESEPPIPMCFVFSPLGTSSMTVAGSSGGQVQTPHSSPNVWTCECYRESFPATCEMSSGYDPHLDPDLVAYWMDGDCIIPASDTKPGSDPQQWNCQDATPHDPSCI